MKTKTGDLRFAIEDLRNGRAVGRNIQDRTPGVEHPIDRERAPWEGDWRLAIAEERVAAAEERLREAEARMQGS